MHLHGQFWQFARPISPFLANTLTVIDQDDHIFVQDYHDFRHGSPVDYYEICIISIPDLYIFILDFNK